MGTDVLTRLPYLQAPLRGYPPMLYNETIATEKGAARHYFQGYSTFGGYRATVDNPLEERGCCVEDRLMTFGPVNRGPLTTLQTETRVWLGPGKVEAAEVNVQTDRCHDAGVLDFDKIKR